ncbi:hypothetical protein [Nostoc sp. PCC 7120 = FACHB-418]|uniref:hypothetical protein n=1 Tax=Nostoc sp. (strain PCC 7120 / SAG 25.82 / UTEX 2576) TaxID=103690 RepID=UPI0002DAD2EC
MLRIVNFGGRSDWESYKSFLSFTVAGQRRTYTVHLRKIAGILSPLPLVTAPHQNRIFI